MPCRRLPPKPRGFTLVELTIVVLIMGILAGIAAPRYAEALTSYRVETAAHRAAADLRLARQCARKTSTSQLVEFDVPGGIYSMPTMGDIDRPGQMYVVDLGAGEHAITIAAADFGGSPDVQFDVYGRPNQSGTVTLQLGSQQRTVEVNSNGDVRVL